MASAIYNGGHSGRQSDAIEFSGPSTRAMINNALLSFLVCIGVANLFLSPSLDLNPAERISGIAVDILLFGGLGVTGFRAALQSRPIMIATHAGLILDSIGARIGLIPWGDIEAFSIMRTKQGTPPRGVTHLVIKVRASYPLCAQPLRSVPPRMWLGWASLKMTGSIVYTGGTFQFSLEEVRQQIHERFESDMLAHDVKTAP